MRYTRRGYLRLLGAGFGIAPAAATGAAGAAEANEPTVVAVGHRHHVDHATSVESFEAAVRDRFAAEAAPRLDGRPALVCFPEATGLMGFFVGNRGRAGRELLDRGRSPTEAMAALAGPYGPQIGYYTGKFPGVTSPGRRLLLALTDTGVRTAVEPFRRLAADHGVHVAVSTYLPPFERVGGPMATVLAGRSADYAYEAASPEVYNWNLVFDPSGDRVAAHRKAYLVPVERDQQAGLGLTGIRVPDLPVWNGPFGRVGTVVSKDAWMPDVNDRYDQLGVDLLLQPEAFGPWALPGEDLWPPDKFQRGGWLMVQKHPGFGTNATSTLTGNFGSRTFDGQLLVAGSAPAGGGAGLLGQAPEPGWLDVGDWDSLAGDPGDWATESRRREFQRRGRQLAPGSGSRYENAYASDAVSARVPTPDDPPGGSVPASGFDASVAPAPGTAQLVPDLAVTDRGPLLAFVDYRHGDGHVYAAWWDGEWTDPERVSDRTPRRDKLSSQWAPVGVGGAPPRLLFLDFRTENWDVYQATWDDGWSANRRVDDAHERSGTLRERGHSSPRVARRADGSLVAAWSDLRYPFVKPQARVAAFDGSWGATVRADGGSTATAGSQPWRREPTEAPAQVFPAVATHEGTVLVAWQQLTPSGPGVFLSRSPDGRSFSTPVRLDDGGPAYRPALASDGGVALAWERVTPTGSELRIRRSPDGESWSGSRALGPDAPSGVRQRYVALCADAAVYESNRGGTSHVYAIPLGGGRPVRVDDAPADAPARAPDAVRLPDGRLLVAWQDARDGVEDVRTAAGSPRSPAP